MYYSIQSDDDNYANFFPENHSIELVKSFRGVSLIENWKPIHFKLMKKKDKRPIADIMTACIPICSRKVYEAIRSVCEGCVEFLPCTIGEEKMDYYVMNVLSVTDAIDYTRSSYQRFSPEGRIMSFEKIIFKDDVQYPIFKIADLLLGYIFCSETLKGLLESIGANGVLFSSALFSKQDSQQLK